MKNKPLSVQIWLVFAAITVAVSLLLLLIFPLTLRDFFTKEIYASIESSQSSIVGTSTNNEFLRGNTGMQRRGQGQMMMRNNRVVNHLLISSQGIINSGSLPVDFLSQVQEQAEQQTDSTKRYSDQAGGEKIFYVITAVASEGEGAFLVSYMWDSYREDLVQTLFNRLAVILLMVLLLSWIPALWLARYLTHPLVALGEKVKKLADRDWHEPVSLARSDEIGQLGDSIEQLRIQLAAQDEAQQSFFQYISHELKTPVMVIRSYIQALKDGIYPKGDLHNSAQVIEDESLRLEKIIRNLLYMSKLDYMESRQSDHKLIHFNEIIEKVVDRLSWQRSEIDWVLQLTPVMIRGVEEQWVVVLENLLDNQIRYAKSKIEIYLRKDVRQPDKVILRIYNDGPVIEEDILENIFERFQKGNQGEFGLGLTIVSRVVNKHGGELWAENEKNGVSFFIKLNM
ncbi:MAG: HAMP domain-containing histidine kinase [Syntrophomonadaceae bacterium]|nr:HAMP domain-containing histidine kinase [Syntrophomonadaceae bacterium]